MSESLGEKLRQAREEKGLTLADGWKTAIAEYYANTGVWPTLANLNAGGTQASTGKYETVTVVTAGTITITYGLAANQKINGSVLGLTAYTNANNDVLWQCGNSAAPSSTIASTATSGGGTNISPQYLPTACHS